jgi:serine/threonine-protein kinase
MGLAEGDTAELAACPACTRVNPQDARFCASCGIALSTSGTEAAINVADPLIGRVIADRYKIETLLGRGGMGVVYKIEHVHIGKLMAMKLLHGELSRDKETLRRFKREAEAASRLDHPNTVQIFDFGRDQGLTYLIMEYLDGHDLGWIIQHEGALTFARCARICAQACASTAQAHSVGIVHRDIKPENVMIIQGRERPDMVKVLDFGLAKLRHSDASQTLTRQGSIIGTPYYMAPEHIRGEEVDARSDVYSLGAVMYKAIAGVPPFWASSPMGVLTKHLTDEVVPPRDRASRRDLPPEADAIILKAMKKDPADRYQSMEELRADLAAYLASIGEELTDSTLSFPTGAKLTTASGKQAVVPVATRGDVDHYEKRLARKGWIGRALLVIALAGVVAGGWYVYRHPSETQVSRSEREPNDEPSAANPLPRDFAMRGLLGKRQSRLVGDTDVYVIENAGGERRFISFSVTGLPNMDIAVDLVKSGIETPALVADSTRVGGPEAVPNFPLGGATYYLRVREVREAGSLPTENVSDEYSISWSYVDVDTGHEREVNDSLELAETIAVGVPRRGYVGWEGDEDIYCAEADGPRVTVSLEAVPDVDLVLRVVDRVTASSTKIDTGNVGQPESTSGVGPLRRNTTCFEVSADIGGVGASSNPEAEYTLRLTAEADEPTEGEE